MRLGNACGMVTRWAAVGVGVTSRHCCRSQRATGNADRHYKSIEPDQLMMFTDGIDASNRV